MTSRNNTRIVQQELGREHFATMSRECVLGERNTAGISLLSAYRKRPNFSKHPMVGWSGTLEAEGPEAGETPKKPIYLQVLPRGEVH